MRLANSTRISTSITVFLVFAVVSILAASPAAAVCGNGVIEAGEECDDGTVNGTTNSCCTTQCVFSGKSPDVIVGDITTPARYGNVGGITAYAIGTTSCNIGTCWLKWISNTAEHPVIGQNMFRLKNGRFEHIGQAWLKHGFTALAGSVCSPSCVNPGTGSRLGVNCSDPYSASLNGSQTRLGPKEDVNPSSGVFPYPDGRISGTGDVIFKRLQVRDTDLDATLNPGALYFVEGQYVTRDDAEAKNTANNASYRSVTVGAAPNYNLTLTSTTQRQKAGIQAWKATDPSVTESTASADGLFILAAKATHLGGGIYHYEYALQNFNSQRAGQSFTVPIPAGTIVTNVGFHDVDYHSGEPFAGTDWVPTVSATSVGWATQTHAVNPNANALRWGTLYNFRFDADVAPGSSAVTIGLFRPGAAPSVSPTTVTPGPCGGAVNGVACDDRNACTQTDSCLAGVCTGSSPVVCTALDACHVAGTCAPATGVCSNPEKPNGSACSDGNACTTVDACSGGVCFGSNPVVCTPLDACHNAGTCDSFTGTCTNPAKPDGTACDDANGCTSNDACDAGVCVGEGVQLPGGVDDGVQLVQSGGITTLSWNAASGSTWYAVLRGLVNQLPVGPGGGDEVCLEDNVAGTSATDPEDPPSGEAFWYLIQGQNACGVGPYGFAGAQGVPADPRTSTTCP